MAGLTTVITTLPKMFYWTVPSTFSTSKKLNKTRLTRLALVPRRSITGLTRCHITGLTAIIQTLPVLPYNTVLSTFSSAQSKP
jgi:hypothetical protein